MSNPKKDSKHFVSENIGMKPMKAGGNKGKQMQDKSSPIPKLTK